MRLNKTTGNMSALITHTGNCILGCKFDCSFCWANSMAKRYGRLFIPQFRSKQIQKLISKPDLRIGLNWNGDGWGPWVRDVWIEHTLAYAEAHPNITWYTLTKNPARYLEFADRIPENMILGATLESNLSYTKITKAPDPYLRYEALKELRELGFDIYIIIEPILKFKVEEMLNWIQTLDPIAVEIGAVTGGHLLPEPTGGEIHVLVKQLCRITNVILKPNLKRLYESHDFTQPLEAFF